MPATEKPLKDRLLAGAKMLGELWGKGETCESGHWSLLCSCEKPTKFCRAKKLWADLAKQDVGNGRDWPCDEITEAGPFALVETMRLSEADAAGIQVAVMMRGGGRLAIGVGGQITFAEFAKQIKAPESAQGLFQVLTQFGGVVVDNILGEKPIEIPPAPLPDMGEAPPEPEDPPTEAPVEAPKPEAKP